MGVTTFARSKRVDPPAMPRGDLLLEAPPEIPQPPGTRNFGAVLRMLPMVAGAGAMALMMTSGAGGRGPLGLLMGGMYGTSMLGMMVSQAGRTNDDSAVQLDGARRDYFRYLAQTRVKVRDAAAAQRRAVRWRHPEPDELTSLAGTVRMWERRPDADDFCSVRISCGPQQFAQRITPPESKPIEDLEPLTTGALRRFIRTHRTVDEVPLALKPAGVHLGAAHRRPRRCSPARLRRGGSAGGLARAHRRPADGLRASRPAPAVGVGEVAAAPAAPHSHRRRRLAAAVRHQPRGARLGERGRHRAA